MSCTSYRPPCKILRGQKRTPSRIRRANHLSVMIAPGAEAQVNNTIFNKFCKDNCIFREVKDADLLKYRIDKSQLFAYNKNTRSYR